MSDTGPDLVIYVPLPQADLYEGSRGLETSGGCLAMWLLGRELRRLGYRVEAVGFEGVAGRARLAEQIERGLCAVVYPEALTGNPLRASRVERWVLYHAPIERLRHFIDQGERLWFYWDAFRPPGLDGPPLRAFDAGLDRFTDLGAPRRGTAFRISKGADYHNRPGEDLAQQLREARRSGFLPPVLQGVELEPVVLLPDHMDRHELLEQLNRFRLFVSYDWESATSAIAALCGCVSVIAARPGLGRPDLLPCFRFGIALGLDDLEHALTTQHLLAGDLRQHEDAARRTVARFGEVVGASAPP